MTSTPVTIIPDDGTLLRLADEAAFENVFYAKFAPGEVAAWTDHTGAIHNGRVVRQGTGRSLRLEVENDATGAVYWIRGHRVLAAIRAGVELSA